ncbi:MAG: zf-HC2 domain-containing protein [Gemmatimonadaceae bacterium]
MKLRLMFPWKRAPLDCEAVMRQLWDYLDNELTSERMDAIRGHLAMCARCYPQYDFEREFLTNLSRLRPQHSNPAMLRARVIDALQRSGFDDGGTK